MSNYEHPDYEVMLKEPPYELRTYEQYTVVEYSNDKNPDGDTAFRTLFRYISTENKANLKIKMTVPVFEEVDDQHVKMAFVVSKAFKGQPPEPTNAMLSVKTVESGLFAVISYRGRSNTAVEQEMTEKLTQWTQEKGYKIISNFILAFYNDPFTPGIFRHNEMLVKVSNFV